MRGGSWCRNLGIKDHSEEIYVVSHHVHHAFSEQPGDPYNVHARVACTAFSPGICTNRSIGACRARTMTICACWCATRACGSTATSSTSAGDRSRHPVAYTVLHYVLNWAVWYAALYAIGGHALATALFGWSFVWAVGIRAHNYDLHAGGKDRRRDGVDFDRSSMAVSAFWPGLCCRRVAQQPPLVSEQRARGVSSVAARRVVRVRVGVPAARRCHRVARLQGQVLRAALQSVPRRTERAGEGCASKWWERERRVAPAASGAVGRVMWLGRGASAVRPRGCSSTCRRR